MGTVHVLTSVVIEVLNKMGLVASRISAPGSKAARTLCVPLDLGFVPSMAFRFLLPDDLHSLALFKGLLTESRSSDPASSSSSVPPPPSSSGSWCWSKVDGVEPILAGFCPVTYYKTKRTKNENVQTASRGRWAFKLSLTKSVKLASTKTEVSEFCPIHVKMLSARSA